MSSKTVNWLNRIILVFILIGICSRIFFVFNVSQSPIFSTFLPKTDDFNYHIMAENLNHSEPLNLRMTVYPLYLKFVRLIYSFNNNQPWGVYSVQLLLSLLSVWLIYLTGKELFGIQSGIGAGLLYLFYKMNYLYDVQLLNTALSQFLIVTTFYFFVVNRKSPKLWKYIGFVVSGILLCQFRIFFWALILPGVLYFIVRERQLKHIKLLVMNAVLLVVGFSLFQVFHTPESYKHKFGILFYMGNHNGADGLFMTLEGVPNTPEGHNKDALKEAYYCSDDKGDVDKYWIRKAIKDIRNEPLEYGKLLLRKVMILFNNHEVKNNTSVYLYEDKTLLKYLPRVSFSLLLGFGAIGLLFGWMNHRPMAVELTILCLLVLLIICMPLCARYRMPLVPFLSLFGGYGVSFFYGCLAPLNSKQLGFSLAILLGILVFSSVPLKGLDKQRDLDQFNRIYEKKCQRVEDVEGALGRYSNRDVLAPNDILKLSQDLSRLHLYREFFDIHDSALGLSEDTEIDHIRVIKQKALVNEWIWNFEKAQLEWERLTEFKQIKNLAEKKVGELGIYQELLS